MTASVRLGFICSVACATMWGLLPIYFRFLDHIGPAEMLVHRIVWSVPCGLVLVMAMRHWPHVRAILSSRKALWLCLSAGLLGCNWFIYIWAVAEERVMEASLGYYLNPIVNVIFGAIFFSERLRRLQWAAVGLAAIGVLIMTLALGRFPWVGLGLCMTFAFYAVIKKHYPVDSGAGFLIEILILAPIALVWMGWFLTQPDGRALGAGGSDAIWLLVAGPLTAVPLILFTMAAKRLQLSTVGIMQYVGPTLQFLVATLMFGETFSSVHAGAFILIWIAIIIFTTDSFVGEAKARRLARAASAIR